MGEERYRREFLKANPPEYTRMRKGLPAKEWMLGALEVFRKLRLPDRGLWMKLAVSMFIRDAEIWGKIVHDQYRVN